MGYLGLFREEAKRMGRYVVPEGTVQNSKPYEGRVPKKDSRTKNSEGFGLSVHI